MRIKILIIGVLVIKSFSVGFPDSYYKIQGIENQKKAFIKILLPLIEKGNHIVMNERIFAKRFFRNALNNSFRGLDTESLAELIYLSQKYKIKDFFAENKYLKRIDIIPVSLALAQAALESGWGKSRFIKEANNIFGHWTYGDKGLIPNDREEGKTHKIRIFATLQSSVNAYILNLNRNMAYKTFREKREQFREKHKIFNGLDASKTMINYSELKEKYVEMLDNLINTTNLLYYDSYNPAALMDSA
ncbi:MAG: glucosaminidase domain-containing protein [Sulfurospirillaceae bacterium]|nr:glucosaminidase domain-containing protein [Sulfurospirillaceae bacterium]